MGSFNVHTYSMDRGLPPVFSRVNVKLLSRSQYASLTATVLNSVDVYPAVRTITYTRIGSVRIPVIVALLRISTLKPLCVCGLVAGPLAETEGVCITSPQQTARRQRRFSIATLTLGRSAIYLFSHVSLHVGAVISVPHERQPS